MVRWGLCWQRHESPLFGGVDAGAGDLSSHLDSMRSATWCREEMASPLCSLIGARWALASSTAGSTVGLVPKGLLMPVPIPAVAHPSLNPLCSQAGVKGEPPGTST